jgi:transposase-like protein
MERVQRKRPGPGQPPKYNPETMPRVAKFMCQRGATMAELADAFNVSSSTLYNWLNRYPELHEAVQLNADVFNQRVERALAERAIGFFVTLREEVKDENGKIISPAQRQYYPPDPTSMIFFLKNRMRDRYRDVHKIDGELRVLKTSEDLRIEIRKDILELQAQGYDPKIVDETAPQLSRQRQRRSGLMVQVITPPAIDAKEQETKD